jgi:hypothetical protein
MRPAQLQLLDVFIVALSFDFPHGDILKTVKKDGEKKLWLSTIHSFSTVTVSLQTHIGRLLCYLFVGDFG